jgi:hypothetical protein
MTKNYREIIQQGILYSNGQTYILIEDSPVESPEASFSFQWPSNTARFFVTRVNSDVQSEKWFQIDREWRYVHEFPFHITTNCFLCDYSTRGRKILVEEPPEPKLPHDQINAQLEQSEVNSDN